MKNVKETALNFLDGAAIHHYRFTKDGIEFFLGGSTVIVTDPDEIEYIKSLIKFAKRWAAKKQDIYNYLEWCGVHGTDGF